MKKSYIKYLVFFVLGVLSAILVTHVYEGPGRKITFLQSFEINDSFLPYLKIHGTYVDRSNDLNIVSLECNLSVNTCTESSVFVLESGIAGMPATKDYSIIEKTPTRVVAKYEGLAAHHMFIIDLAERKVTFKAQSNTDPSDVDLYQLEDGLNSLNKLNK